MKFDNKTPIYIQFINDIKDKIISGELKAGERMESVRSYSEIYNINPNTVQKALEKLELEQLVFTNRTSGRFITENQETIDKLKKESLQSEVSKFITSLKNKNFSQDEIKQIFEKIIQGV